MRRSIAAIAVLCLLVAACDGSGADQATTTTSAATTSSGDGTIIAVAERFDPDSVQFVAALERFDSCDALLGHLQGEALVRVGPYGLSGGGVFWGGGLAVEEMQMDAAEGGPVTTVAATATAPQAAGDDGREFSGTNVQVAGVDEPDVIKTDGERILTAVNGTLHYLTVSGDGAGAELVGSLHLGEGWNHRFFVSGDRAIVFSSGDWYAVPEPMLTEVAPAPGVLPWMGPTTLIKEIDLSDPTDMRVLHTLRVEGEFLSARAIGDTVRVVVSSYPDDLPFVYPSSPAAEALAEETNRGVIEQSTLEDWLPSYTLFAGDEVVGQGLVVECDRAHRPAEFAGFETLSVLTFDLGGGLEPGAGTAVLAQGQTVYASTERLYVATNVWVPETLIGDARLESLEEEYSTAIHAFDITGDDPAEYLASGSVDGHLLSQFSLDEYDGYLRVATTRGAPWGWDDDSESAVTVLEIDGDRLVERGRVGDLGRGESIFAVRFIGDAGYVVTFRQTDPLYVIDLSDPQAPVTAGELKVPGYSAYLHPVGEDLLLGIGQDATEDGRTTGAKASLFDVSDPANPREVDVWTMEGGYSEVEWDHLAFLYWDPAQTAVLPLQDWSSGFTGAVVLKTDDGLREAGRIEHTGDAGTIDSGCRPVELGGEEGSEIFVQVCAGDDPGGRSGFSCEIVPEEEIKYWSDTGEMPDLGLEPGDRVEVCWREDWTPPIIRSLVIGDTLWTLSTQRLQANSLADLTRTDTIGLG